MKCLPKDAWLNLILQNWVPVRVTLPLLNFIIEYMHFDAGRACATYLENWSDVAGFFILYFLGITRLISWWCSQWQKSALQYANWQASGYLATLWWGPHATVLFYLTHPVKKYYVVLDHDQSTWMLSIKYLAHALPQSCPRNIQESL